MYSKRWWHEPDRQRRRNEQPMSNQIPSVHVLQQRSTSGAVTGRSDILPFKRYTGSSAFVCFARQLREITAVHTMYAAALLVV